jgi:predicted nuclease of predicted toxin-antitoxin system
MEDKPTPLRFYTDAHIAKAVAEQLRVKGIDVVRCQEVGLADVEDFEHLEYAVREGRVLVTHDADFLRYDSEWRSEGKSHAGIMFVSRDLQGERYIGQIVRALTDYYELIAGGAGSVEQDIANRVFFIG